MYNIFTQFPFRFSHNWKSHLFAVFGVHLVLEVRVFLLKKKEGKSTGEDDFKESVERVDIKN